jgi:hypothetical protein
MDFPVTYEEDVDKESDLYDCHYADVEIQVNSDGDEKKNNT